MVITNLTNEFSVSGEVTEQELIQLSESGTSTLINVRPDNEAPEQKSDQHWIALCHRYDMQYLHVPVLPCQYSESAIQQIKQAIDHAPNKVHCFCRTGTRAAHLFALANKHQYSFQRMQALLKEKGYDLSQIANQYMEQK